MEILAILIPVSLGLGGAGLVAFLWALRNRQFEDPKGDGQRILSEQWDDKPRPKD
ncbi:cbb3-type cytochrome oxidase assembly protein CcoS [Paracoccus rhizosphaerae]|uniref:Cbb3-type cytochrome oxidase assembly protein CcoS n=1 Tax=Paracoccus rhizosphaerae TaxID=1133347 RepID=A0ABV6CNN6_9RHOB|nr:cbb3-type cytochrome oxidase assembly protein CcoS [Paracoccus rhizosphaerae]